MKKGTWHIEVLAGVLFVLLIIGCKEVEVDKSHIPIFKEELRTLVSQEETPLLKRSLESIYQIIDAEKRFTNNEAEALLGMQNAFKTDTLANPREFKSYLDRKRTLIISWESPEDGKTTFAWLRLPKNWSADSTYPLYVHLHGHWDVAQNPIPFMAFTYNEGPSTTRAFEDGYWLSPWARGNEWYHGRSKTDVWEAMAELKKVVTVDTSRQYLCGHSMGGYGTWHIAQESADQWAALGLHSAALHYKDAKYVTEEYASKLKETPVYFIWGDEEGRWMKDNEVAYDLLLKAGNKNIEIYNFEGGHDYNEEDVERMYNWMRTHANF